jgi:peptidoglycan-associated lipoprotein
MIGVKEEDMKNRSLLFAIIVSLSVFVLWGCPKKAEVTSSPETQETAPPVQEAPPVEQKAEPVAEPKPEPKDEAKERAAAAAAGLQPIYFDFDRSFVRDDAKAVMKANAEWLKANPKVKVRIEGNCDERGTREYNQALGQRRAASAKKYLTDLGVSAGRISLISYGKEKPVCTESTENCWQKNRRGDIVAAE